VGGFRVSMYNALPLSSIEALVELINQFAKEHV
jgi:phosphoserine aminotransferase